MVITNAIFKQAHIDRDCALIKLAMETDAAFLWATLEECTCYSKPEESCLHCSRVTRAEIKQNQLLAMMRKGIE